MKLRLLLGPHLLHGQHALAQQLEARVVLGAVVLHLVDVPAAAHGKNEAPAGELVEACHLLGGDDRVPLRDEADAGAELDPLGRRRGKRQGDERIVRVLVALGQLTAARERRLAADGDVGVLAHEQRLEPPLLDGPRQLADVDAVVGREIENASQHALLLQRNSFERHSMHPRPLCRGQTPRLARSAVAGVRPLAPTLVATTMRRAEGSDPFAPTPLASQRTIPLEGLGEGGAGRSGCAR